MIEVGVIYVNLASHSHIGKIVGYYMTFNETVNTITQSVFFFVLLDDSPDIRCRLLFARSASLTCVSISLEFFLINLYMAFLRGKRQLIFLAVVDEVLQTGLHVY